MMKRRRRSHIDISSRPIRDENSTRMEREFLAIDIHWLKEKELENLLRTKISDVSPGEPLAGTKTVLGQTL